MFHTWIISGDFCFSFSNRNLCANYDLAAPINVHYFHYPFTNSYVINTYMEGIITLQILTHSILIKILRLRYISPIGR